MSTSHGHKPYVYPAFIPDMDGQTLVKAVDMKQNMYNEGLSKVQSYYEAMSDLPLERDVDKQYMNDELNKVFSIMNENIGNSDFSNPNMVKSFIDVANPLKNDPTLKNALASSNEINNRKQTIQDIMEKSLEKYNDANYWDYMNDVEAWYNDPTPGAKLSSKVYKPYIDNSKKHADVIKNLTPKISSDIARMKGTGMYTTEELKYLEQSRIKDALMQSMTPQEVEQMNMDAKYQTHLMSDEEKYNTVMKTYSQIMETNKTLASVKGIENQTGTTQEQYTNNANAAAEILNSLLTAEGEINRDVIDNLHTNVYISNWADGMGKTYSYAQTKQKLTTDPFALANLNHRNQVTRLGIQYENNMKLKGFQKNKTTGQWEKASYFADLTSDKTKAPKAPALFVGSVNESLFEKLKNGEALSNVPGASLSGDTYARYIDIAKNKGWITSDKATLNKFSAGTDLSTGEITFNIEFTDYDSEDNPKVVKNKYITEKTLAGNAKQYFNYNGEPITEGTTTEAPPAVINSEDAEATQQVPVEPEIPETPDEEKTPEEIQREIDERIQNQNG